MMCPTLRTLAIMAVLMACASLWAQDEDAPGSWFATSEQGGAFFKMVAPKWESKDGKRAKVREPFGVAYTIGEDGGLTELWRTSGWHGDELFLSNNGRYLVRVGAQARDLKNHTDLAVAFYDRGVLLREYRVCDLLKKADAVETLGSQYRWRLGAPGGEAGIEEGLRGLLPEEKEPELRFHLRMIDQTDHRFDVATGKILSTDSHAGSGGNAGVKDGTAVTEEPGPGPDPRTPSWPPAWHEAFEISTQSLETRWIKDVKTQGWRVAMLLRRKLGLPCEILGWFPMDKAGKVETTLTAQEIMKAVEDALAHPFVTKRMDAGRTNGLRLYVEGNALHNNRATLIDCLGYVRPVSGPKDGAEDLNHWARCSLMGPLNVRNWPDVFVNTRSQDLIVVVPYVDMGTFYFQSHMQGADGEPSKIKSQAQLDEEESRRRGQEILQAAAFKADYEAHFILSEVGAGEHNGQQEWHVTLTPRDALPTASVARKELLLSKQGKAETRIPAAEALAALKMAAEHPAVLRALREEQKEFAAHRENRMEWEKPWVDAKEELAAEEASYPKKLLTLQLGGDRLFQDDKELRKWLGETKPGLDPTTEMRHWACIEILSAIYRSEATRVYLNTQTREVMSRKTTRSQDSFSGWKEEVQIEKN